MRQARLGIEDAHLEALAALPGHHRDPFDRLLISQCRVENLRAVTSDRVFAAYGVRVVNARS